MCGLVWPLLLRSIRERGDRRRPLGHTKLLVVRDIVLMSNVNVPCKHGVCYEVPPFSTHTEMDCFSFLHIFTSSGSLAGEGGGGGASTGVGVADLGEGAGEGTCFLMGSAFLGTSIFFSTFPDLCLVFFGSGFGDVSSTVMATI